MRMTEFELGWGVDDAFNYLWVIESFYISILDIQIKPLSANPSASYSVDLYIGRW